MRLIFFCVLMFLTLGVTAADKTLVDYYKLVPFKVLISKVDYVPDYSFSQTDTGYNVGGGRGSKPVDLVVDETNNYLRLAQDWTDAKEKGIAVTMGRFASAKGVHIAVALERRTARGSLHYFRLFREKDGKLEDVTSLATVPVNGGTFLSDPKQYKVEEKKGDNPIATRIVFSIPRHGVLLEAALDREGLDQVARAGNGNVAHFLKYVKYIQLYLQWEKDKARFKLVRKQKAIKGKH